MRNAAAARWALLTFSLVLTRCQCSDSIGSAAPNVPDIDVCVAPTPGAEEVCYQAVKAERRAELCTGTGECLRPELDADLGTIAANASGELRVRVINRGGLPLKLFNPTVAPGSSIMYRLNPPQTTAADRVYTVLKKEEEFEFAVQLRGNLCGPQNARFVLTSNDAEKPASAPASFDPGPPDSPIYLNVTGKVSGPCLCPVAGGVLDFGAVPLGREPIKRWSFESCGDQPLNLVNTTIGMNPTNRFSVHATVYPPTNVLQPGEQGHVDVKYRPETIAPPADAGELWIYTNAPTAQPYYPVQLIGQGVPRPSCILGALPTNTSFGVVESGETATRNFRIFNQGQITCHFNSITRTAGSTEFNLTAGAPAPVINLAPDQSTTVQVTFSPSTDAPQSATFQAKANDDDGFDSTVDINVTANASVPDDGCVLDIQPDYGDFGEVVVGGSKQINFTLANIAPEGDDFLGGFANRCIINSATIIQNEVNFRFTGDLGFLANLMLLPGDFLSTSLQVSFEPQSAGIKTGTLRFNSNSVTGSNRDIPLWGSAKGALLCYDLDGGTPGTTQYNAGDPPPVLNWGAVATGAAVEKVVTLTNCGAGQLRLRGLTMDPAGGLAFIRKAPTAQQLPTELAPGQSLFVKIEYRPANQNGDFSAFEVITNADNAELARFNLRGNYSGSCDKIIRCNPGAVAFGSVEANTGAAVRQAVCSNFGTAPIAVSNVTKSGDAALSIVSPTTATLSPGEGFTVQVGCEPTTAGAKNGQIQIVSNACDATPYNMTVACTGVVPELPECTGVDVYTPVEKWHWDGSSQLPSGFDDVWMTPIVINLTDDNADGVIDVNDSPEVVFTVLSSSMALPSGGQADSPDALNEAIDPQPAFAVAVRGDNGQELWRYGTLPAFKGDPAAMAFESEAQLAAGDIDGDGLPEIVGVKYTYIPPRECEMSDIECQFKGRFAYGQLLALEHDGTFKWESDRWHMDDDMLENMSGISIGDMDGDGFPEIVIGHSIFDHNGKLLFEGATPSPGNPGDGSASNGHGTMSVLIDLTGDGMVDLLAGRTAFRKDGSKIFDRKDLSDGAPVIANLDSDNQPEIIMLLANNDLIVLEHDGTTKWGPRRIETGDTEDPGFIGTNMAVGDMDGDGYPEIALAAKNILYVFEHTLDEKWRATISDQTGASGPTTFDFNGDGKAEVLHADEQTLWVFDGVTGAIRYQAPRSSRTIADNPVVADVDNDGHADLVVCGEAPIQGAGKVGVIAYGNDKNNWAATRRIWNQHTYHISNSNESGIIPAVEGPGWLEHNVFRSNVTRCRR